MKYNEDKIIKEIHDYIKGTYGEHYSASADGFQVQDMLRHLNIDKDFVKQMRVMYLCRYGKKQVRIEKDLVQKAIHYVILLMSSEDKDDMGTNTGDVDSFNGGTIRINN